MMEMFYGEMATPRASSAVAAIRRASVIQKITAKAATAASRGASGGTPGTVNRGSQ